MFGNMLGDFQERQEELRKKLATVMVEGQSEEGGVRVIANANKEIVDIDINPEVVDLSDKDQVEDLVLIAVNRAIQAAVLKESEEAKKLVEDIMPPGLGNLGNLFGM